MSEEKFPSQLAERFQIRLPDGMRDKLREEAARSGRSMNTEIVHRLALTLAYRENEPEGILQKLDSHEDEILKLDQEIRDLTDRLEQSVRLNHELKDSAARYYARMNAFLVYLSENIGEMPDHLVLFLHDHFVEVAKEQDRIDQDFKSEKSAEVAARVIRDLRNSYVHSTAGLLRKKMQQRVAEQAED